MKELKVEYSIKIPKCPYCGEPLRFVSGISGPRNIKLNDEVKEIYEDYSRLRCSKCDRDWEVTFHIDTKELE